MSTTPDIREIESIERKLEKLEKRIDNLEKLGSWIKGTIFGGSIILGTVLWIWNQLKDHLTFH